MDTVFLDASILASREEDEIRKYDVQQNRVSFEFPNGFEQLRLIEECRALNALDVSDPDNFDLMYDITMQMLVGKPVFIYYTENGKKEEVARFVVTDRYMNLRGVAFVDSYPVVVNWLVEYIASYLSKKYPLSLKDIQATVREKEERMKKSLKQGVQIKTS